MCIILRIGSQMRGRKYNHLSSADRIKLYKLLFEGISLQEIATSIGYHKSTVYRGLYRNSTGIGYRPDLASQQYLLRRRYKPSKIDMDENIKEYILSKLKERWSPEQIAGRLKKEWGYAPVSYETIYQYIYSPSGKKLKLYQCLRKKRKYRYPRVKRKRQRPHVDKASIHSRPEEISNRLTFGHWEGDLILFHKTRTNVFTLRERKTRLLIAIKNASRKAKETSKSLINYMGKRADLVRSLTLDNDPDFAEYKGIADVFKSEIYFCDPYKSYPERID